MAQKSLATYYRSGGFRKVYPCRAGTDPGTVDLLDADGELLVGACPVIDDPEAVPRGELPGGYAVIDGPAPPAAPAKKAPRKKAAAQVDEPPSEGDDEQI